MCVYIYSAIQYIHVYMHGIQYILVDMLAIQYIHVYRCIHATQYICVYIFTVPYNIYMYICMAYSIYL